MSDVEKTVTAIQGNSVKREILTEVQDNYLLTWDGENNNWHAAPAQDPIIDGPFLVNDLSFHTSTGAVINIGSASLGADDSITISTDCVNGGNNGPIYIDSGTEVGSLSGSSHNIYVNAGSQNGANQGSVFVTTGFGFDTGQSIMLDALSADTSLYDTTQICMTAQNIRFNSSGFVFNRIVNVTNNYTINNGRTTAFDYIILTDTASASFTVTLPPSPIKGETYIVKDDGNAGTNNVTIDGNGKNIDGATSFVINTNYGGGTFIYNNTQWNIISRV